MTHNSFAKLVLLVMVAVLVGTQAFPAFARNPGNDVDLYTQQTLQGAKDTLLGVAAGSALGIAAGIAFNPDLMAVDHSAGFSDPETLKQVRSLTTSILVGASVGAAAGATWGVVEAATRRGVKGNAPLAFASALMLEAGWYWVTNGGSFELQFKTLPKQVGSTGTLSTVPPANALGLLMLALGGALLGFHL